jgi:hypothetical protein
MTTESQAISHLRALIKDPLGHVAEACEFLARVDHIGDVNKMVADGWQPAETAPEDGTKFLSLNTRQGDLMTVTWFHRGFGYFFGAGGNHLYQFTHWMPLPNPPENEEQIA